MVAKIRAAHPVNFFWSTTTGFPRIYKQLHCLHAGECHNYANPVYGVATICHQVPWGHPSLFHTATSLLIWYKMFCVRDVSHRLQDSKSGPGLLMSWVSSTARPSACPAPNQYIIVAAEVLVPSGARPSTARESVTLMNIYLSSLEYCGS